jgi:hypothetical protein
MKNHKAEECCLCLVHYILFLVGGKPGIAAVKKYCNDYEINNVSIE